MSLNDRLAAYFKSRPNVWIDGRQLAEVGGYAAFRTRVSNLRRQRGMTIENRWHDECVRGRKFRVTEYRLVVSEPEQLPLSDQWSVGA